MMKGHERPHAALAKRLKHGSIAAEGVGVPAVFLGLDAAPLQREPQGVDAKILGAIEILFGVSPPVASQTSAVAGLDTAFLLPRGPLMIEVAALHLVC